MKDIDKAYFNHIEKMMEEDIFRHIDTPRGKRLFCRRCGCIIEDNKRIKSTHINWHRKNDLR